MKAKYAVMQMIDGNAHDETYTGITNKYSHLQDYFHVRNV